jgi:hypothetical protein
MKQSNQLIQEVVHYLLTAGSRIYSVESFLDDYGKEDRAQIKEILLKLSRNPDAWPESIPSGSSLLAEAQKEARLACILLKIAQ